jgi:uncharacterized membrane protein
MDASHVHLISNHLPIIGVFCGIVVLAFGMARQSPPTLAASYLLLIISGLIGLVAYFSGEGAEEVAEHLPGVTHDSIEVHEDWGMYTLISYVILFIFSVIGFLRSKNHYHRIRKLAMIILVLAIVSFGIAAVTGYLGGLIRHTELRTLTQPVVDSTGH